MAAVADLRSTALRHARAGVVVTLTAGPREAGEAFACHITATGTLAGTGQKLTGLCVGAIDAEVWITLAVLTLEKKKKEGERETERKRQ